MWDFTSGFFSPIRSLDISQFLNSLIMIRPRLSRTSLDYHELVVITQFIA